MVKREAASRRSPQTPLDELSLPAAPNQPSATDASVINPQPENGPGSVARSGRPTWGTLQLHPDTDPKAHVLNPILQRVWDAQERVSWIIVRVILQELGMTVPQFCAISSDLKPAQLYNLLSPISKRALRQGHLDRALGGVLKNWNALAVLNKGTPVEKLLKDASRKITDAVLKHEPSPLPHLLRSWRLRAFDAFQSSWADEYRQFCKSGKQGFLPFSFGELLSVAKASGLIPRKLAGRELWNHPVTKEARKMFLAETTARQVARPTAELVMRLEFAGYSTSAERLRDAGDLKAAGLTWNTARDIAHFDPVSPEGIEPVMATLSAKKLFSRRDLNQLRGALAQDYTEHTRSYGFSQLVHAELKSLGITTSHIAEALAVPQPQGKSMDRADLIRIAITGRGFQRDCPPAVVALLAARSEPHFHELLSERRREIVRELRLRRGAHEPTVLRVERSLWGVGVDELSVDAELIRNLEWGRRTERLTPNAERQTCEEVRRIGLTRAQGALRTLLTKYQLGSTAETIERINTMIGATDRTAAMAHIGLQRAGRFMRGEEVPPLPVFVEILAGYNVGLGPTALRRWYLDSADHQKLLQPNAVARCVVVDMLSRSSDMNNFLVSLPQKGRIEVSLRRFLRGMDVPNQEFAVILESMGIERSSDRHKLLVSIFRTKDAVRGVHGWLESLPNGEQLMWRQAIADLASVVRADRLARGAPLADISGRLSDLIFLNREGRFSRDPALPASARSIEKLVQPTMQLLAGLTSSEIESLVDGLTNQSGRKTGDGIPVAHRSLVKKLGEQGLTPQSLAPVLVKVFVDRGMQSKQGLLTSIEGALSEHRISLITPYAVLAALAAKDAQEFAGMLTAEGARIKEYSGAWVSEGEVEAQVWGIHPRVLHSPGMRALDGRAVSTARTIGLQLCRAVLKELDEDRSIGLSRGLIKACLYRSGLDGQGFSRAAGVRSSSMFRFLRGQGLLDWSRFSRILTSADVTPSPLVKLWWNLDVAQHLKIDPRGLSDRQRVVSAILHEGNGNLASLVSRRLSKSQVNDLGRSLRSLEAGKYSKPRVEKVFKALNIPTKSQRGLFLRNVFQTGSIKNAISEILRSHHHGRSPEHRTLGKGAIQALQEFLIHETRVMEGVDRPHPELEQYLACRAYCTAPLGRRGGLTANDHLLDAAREIFPGVTREELREGFEWIVQGVEASLNMVGDPARRGWEDSLSELQHRLGSGYDSIEVNDAKREVVFGKEVISEALLSDILFGINRPVVREKRVNVMRMRMTFDLPVFHPGDHNIVLDENVPTDGSSPDSNDEADD